MQGRGTSEGTKGNEMGKAEVGEKYRRQGNVKKSGEMKWRESGFEEMGTQRAEMVKKKVR